MFFLIIFRPVLLRMRNVPDKFVQKKIRTYFTFKNLFFFFSKIIPRMRMWKNIVEPDRPQMTIWRMRIACWILKATHKHSECHTCRFSTATMFARTRLSVSFYLDFLSCLCSESNHISTVAHPTYRKLALLSRLQILKVNL